MGLLSYRSPLSDIAFLSGGKDGNEICLTKSCIDSIKSTYKKINLDNNYKLICSRSYVSTKENIFLLREELLESRNFNQSLEKVGLPFFNPLNTGYSLELVNEKEVDADILVEAGFVRLVNLNFNPDLGGDTRSVWIHRDYYKQTKVNNGAFLWNVPAGDNKCFRYAQQLKLNAEESNLLETLNEYFLANNFDIVDSLDKALIVVELMNIYFAGEPCPYIAEVQQRLRLGGFLKNPASNEYDKYTDEALRDYCLQYQIFYSNYLYFDLLLDLRQSICCGTEQLDHQQIAKTMNGKWLNLNSNFHSPILTRQAVGPVQALPRQLVVTSNSKNGWDSTNKTIEQTRDCKQCIILTSNLKINDHHNLNILYVENTTNALARLAHFSRSKIHGFVVAVTGSTGKTTTKEAITRVLSNSLQCSSTPGTANALRAICYQMINSNIYDDCHIFELGLANNGSSIRDMSSIIKPFIAIVTNVQSAHLEGYTSISELQDRKLDIGEGIIEGGYLLIDGDDIELVSKAKERYQNHKIHVLTVSLREMNSDMKINSISGVDDVSSANFVFKNHSVLFSTLLIGEHWLKMIGFVLLLSYILGLSLVDVEKCLYNLDLPNGRGKILRNSEYNILIYDSHFNANPASMEADLAAFQQYALQRNLKSKLLFVGEMRELGDMSSFYHKQVLYLLEKIEDSRVYLIGHEWSKLNIKKFRHFESVNDLIDNINLLIRQGDFVFIKGSNGNNLSRLIQPILNLK